MAVSYEEALAMVAGPGSPLEVADRDFGGVTYRAFRTTPNSLRDIFETARGKEGTFIVYEDERWSFGDHVARVDAIAASLVNHYGIGRGDRKYRWRAAGIAGGIPGEVGIARGLC